VLFAFGNVVVEVVVIVVVVVVVAVTGRPRNRWWNYVQTDINKRKITNWKERSKTQLTVSSPLRGEGPHWTVAAVKKEEEKKKT